MKDGMASMQQLEMPVQREAKHLQSMLDGCVDGKLRHYMAGYHDVVDAARIVVDRFLPGEVREADIAIAQVLHVAQPGHKDVRHQNRLAQHHGEKSSPASEARRRLSKASAQSVLSAMYRTDNQSSHYFVVKNLFMRGAQ